MGQSGKPALSPSTLRMLLIGWIALVAVAGFSTFLITLAITDSEAPRPTRTVARATSSGITASQAAPTQTLPTASVAGSLTPTQRSVQDDGIFALGGQLQPYPEFPHRDEIQSAGMSWVKYQIIWKPGMGVPPTRELVKIAHDQGFKVLVSIKGDVNPSSIDFTEYVSFLERLNRTVGHVPDAVEIWNEMNFDVEWPANDISGSSYVTKMLAPAYQAIKGNNPQAIVIAGAPTPTGAFGGCGSIDTGVSVQSGCDDDLYIRQMRDAGAANYADCIGVHFNSGATPPSATSGHPNDSDGRGHYSWYYQKMVDLYSGTFNKPLCFTELGYVSSEGFGAPPSNFPWASTVSAQEQAEWLGQTVDLARKSGKVRLVIIWNVDFPSSDPGDPKSMYAIVRPDGSCAACQTLWQAMTAP